jgi:serine/threonine protein kinase
VSNTTPLFRRRPASPAVAPPPLTSVGGFRLLRRLGAGGMSEVYLAYDEMRSCPVAVKVLPDDLAKNSTYVDRFRREAEIGQLIEHPNIVRCFEGDQDPVLGRYYLVMEFIKGQSAQSRLEKQGPFALAEATRVILDIARALEELHHRHYVHRDVKPGNILIAEDGRAKLADLGVAKLLTDASELTTLDQGIGTPYYMPWEQTLNAGLVDQRSDLFALGATYYHLIAGRVPFPGKDVTTVARLKEEGEFPPVRSFDPSLPRSIDTILLKMLARMPSDRFQNAAQLIDVLSASGLTTEPTAGSPLADTDLPPAVTRPDLKAARRPRGRSPKEAAWTIQFRHAGSAWRRIPAMSQDIARWYEEGLLPDDFYLAKDGQKTFRHFRSVPEFARLERRPKPKEKPAPRRRRFGFLGLGIAMTVATTAISASALHALCAS